MMLDYIGHWELEELWEHLIEFPYRINETSGTSFWRLPAKNPLVESGLEPRSSNSQFTFLPYKSPYKSVPQQSFARDPPRLFLSVS